MTDANLYKANGYAILGQNGTTESSAAYVTGVLMTGHNSLVASGASTAAGYQVYALPASSTKYLGYMFAWPGVWNPCFKAAGYIVYVPLFPPTQNFEVDFDFMEERFPDCISFGSSGGPGFMTNLTEFDSGIVNVNAEWEVLRARYSVTFENTPPDEMKLVEDFFYVAKGRAIGFRFKDWNDYQIVQQNIGVGDGVTNQFQLFKRYQSGDQFYDRPIRKPLEVSSNGEDMQISVDGVIQIVNGEAYVNESKGIISFQVPPPLGSVIRIEYAEFDVPVRFDTDELDISFEEFRQLALEVPLVEVITE